MEIGGGLVAVGGAVVTDKREFVVTRRHRKNVRVKVRFGSECRNSVIDDVNILLLSLKEIG